MHVHAVAYSNPSRVAIRRSTWIGQNSTLSAGDIGLAGRPRLSMCKRILRTSRSTILAAAGDGLQAAGASSQWTVSVTTNTRMRRWIRRQRPRSLPRKPSATLTARRRHIANQTLRPTIFSRQAATLRNGNARCYRHYKLPKDYSANLTSRNLSADSLARCRRIARSARRWISMHRPRQLLQPGRYRAPLGFDTLQYLEPAILLVESDCECSQPAGVDRGTRPGFNLIREG